MKISTVLAPNPNFAAQHQDNPTAVIDQIEKFCRRAEALGYHGTGSAQFLLDKATGDITFLEINPRLGANSKLVESVLPYVSWFVDLVEGEKLPDRPDPWAYKRGQRFVWLKGENQTYKKLLSEGRYNALASRFGQSLWNSIGAVHGVFSPDDPAATQAAQQQLAQFFVDPAGFGAGGDE